jgi:hypothetical protein
MSRRRNGVRKSMLEKLNEINHIDKKMKRRKFREDELEFSKLMSRRNLLRSQLK